MGLLINNPDGRGYISHMEIAYLDVPVYIEIMGERFRVLNWNQNLGAYHVQQVERHVFDPGGRAHWDMPRCAMKICREMEIHPNHVSQEQLDDLNRSAGRNDLGGMDADLPGSGSRS